MSGQTGLPKTQFVGFSFQDLPWNIKKALSQIEELLAQTKIFGANPFGGRGWGFGPEISNEIGQHEISLVPNREVSEQFPRALTRPRR